MGFLIGIIMLAAVFIGIFLMVVDIEGLKGATLIFGSAILIALWVGIGAFLISGGL